jgi:hypothetical protein
MEGRVVLARRRQQKAKKRGQKTPEPTPATCSKFGPSPVPLPTATHRFATERALLLLKRTAFPRCVPTMRRASLLALVVVVVAMAAATHAYVLPGTRPQEYNRGDRIDLKVVQLDSVRTQVTSLHSALNPLHCLNAFVLFL